MGNTYLLDGEVIGWHELIREAVDLYGYGRDFGCSVIRCTSGAAKVLREHGHTVEENPSTTATKQGD